ncbi:hypothetical protein ACFWN5_30350 [Streptomyces sp. NPDC058430]|uniref:hypothetical protein n=1 Tax=unclassified Streptomyces TaxID=2593676 RepID=UPI00363D7836
MNWTTVICGATTAPRCATWPTASPRPRHDTVFPWGAFAANLTAHTGHGLLAGAVGATVPDALQHFIGPDLVAVSDVRRAARVRHLLARQRHT